ncbi:hypothetical protein LCGC14_1947670 [marine sediment metagenome]|uniref:Uncharacterized protein n=1 Tax=marine sediment metagenome TaxID=412755 RepID=A0A0F9FIB4_9ZZZZ
MTTIELARHEAATALVILINNLIDRPQPAVTPALADTAVDAQAELARLVTQAALRQAAEDVLLEHLANPPSTPGFDEVTMKQPP